MAKPEEAASRYPLAWPAHKPRAKNRRPGKFSSDGSTITTSQALDRLENQLDRIGAAYALVSSNIEPRLDGRPRSGQPEPNDPGVAVYFQLKGKPHVLACDTYTKVSQNIAALAAHLEASRAIERYGVATAAEVLQAFQALPAPDHVPARRPWWVVLGMGDAEPAKGSVTESVIGLLYREAARQVHQAAGDLTGVNLAKEEALRWLTT